MNEIVKYTFLFLSASTIINLAVAVIAKVKTKNKEYNYLIWYWISIFFAFAVLASLTHSRVEMGLAYYFQIIPMFIKADILGRSRNLRFNFKIHVPIYTIGFILTTYMLYSTNMPFSLTMLPLVLGTSCLLISPVINTLFAKRKESNWIEKSMAVLFILSILNHFHFAFFRSEPSLSLLALGPAFAFAHSQALTILLPLLINYRREINERDNLMKTFEKISGVSLQNAIGIDEIYKQLQYQILEKDLFAKELQKSKQSLHEEMEINQILIKTVSHDLANPFTVIKAYVEMLEAGRIQSENHEKTFHQMKLNATSALEMIARVRHAILNRAQADLVKLRDVDINLALEKLITRFETGLKNKNLRIVYLNDLPQGTLIKADLNALIEHVFSNILSNAIKFSFENSEIHITTKDLGDKIEVVFKDFGTGIDESRLAKKNLMSTEGTLGEQGSGFGLLVLGFFVKKFGGSYEIKSQIDSGTAISVKLNKSSPTRDFQQQESNSNIYS